MELGVSFLQVRDSEAQVTLGGGQGTVAEQVFTRESRQGGEE
jgi:hypothetical protein